MERVGVVVRDYREFRRLWNHPDYQNFNLFHIRDLWNLYGHQGRVLFAYQCVWHDISLQKHAELNEIVQHLRLMQKTGSIQVETIPCP